MTEHVDVDVAVIGMGPGGEVAAGRLLAGGRRTRPRGPGVPLAPGTLAPVLELPAQHLRSRGGRRRWPRSADGRRAWTFHSLRHVFATWALAQPGARIEDVSRLLGQSTVRVTQDLYISPDGDLFDASTGRRRRGRGRTDEKCCL
jgi:integrase